MKKLFIIIGLLFFIVACKTFVADPVEPEVVEPEVVEPEVVEPEVVEPEVDEPVPTQLLTDLKCVDTKLQGVLTNINGKTVEFNKDLKIIVNGKVVASADCEKSALEIGESTFCNDLSGHLHIREGQTSKVVVSLLRESQQEVVTCD